MTSADDLAAVLRRAGAGDRSAFTRVYDVTAERAYGICCRLLDDPRVAEEAAEQAYREIWRRASTYDATRGSAAAWVLAVVHRVAVARAHETGVVRRSSVAPGMGGSSESEAILAQLSTLEWASLELAYFGGRRYRDVATLLGLGPDAAQARIRDGLVKVRELMDVG